MTPVKDKLSGRQYMLPGIDNHGRESVMYISNEVDGILHINLGGKELFVDTNKLLDIIGLLKFGDAYQASLDRVKEAKHAKHDMDL